MKALPRALAFALLLLLAPAPAVRAQSLVADLTSHAIALSTGFEGRLLTLFGAVEGEGDILVQVRGPTQNLGVAERARRAGLWLKAEPMVFRDVPAFYALAATAPLAGIASAATRQENTLGLEALAESLVPVSDPSDPRTRDPAAIERHRQALVRLKRGQDLFSEDQKVTVLGGRLFRADFLLPGSLPPGDYTVEVILLQNGVGVAAQATPLRVERVGLAATVVETARRRAPLYGALAVALALMAGWMAAVLAPRA